MSQKQKIKSGDTLSQIAKDRGTTLAVLLAANPSIKNANSIRVGQSITIPTKQMSPGDAQRNPYKGTTRTELKGIDSQKQQKKNNTKEYKGTTRTELKGIDSQKQQKKNNTKETSIDSKANTEKRSKSATRMMKMREATKRYRSKG